MGDPADACALVDGHTYTSQEQLECGISPMGTELCNWTIGFDAGQFVWSYSDVGSSGDYTCLGLELMGSPGAVVGTVSADGSVLTWDGVAYDRD